MRRRRRTPPPEHRRRVRRGRGRRHALPGDGVRRWRGAVGGGAARAAAGRRRVPGGARRRSRVGSRSRRWVGSPRHQAGQPDPRDRRRHEGARLRAGRRGRGDGRSDRGEHGDGHARLHRPGASDRRPLRRRALRRVLARLHPVPPARRACAVPRRFHAPEARRPPRPGPHAGAGREHPGEAGPRPDADHGERPGRPLPDGRSRGRRARPFLRHARRGRARRSRLPPRRGRDPNAGSRSRRACCSHSSPRRAPRSSSTGSKRIPANW